MRAKIEDKYYLFFVVNDLEGDFNGLCITGKFSVLFER